MINQLKLYDNHNKTAHKNEYFYGDMNVCHSLDESSVSDNRCANPYMISSA